MESQDLVERGSESSVSMPASAMARLVQALRDLPGTLTPAAWLAGLVAVMMAYTGPMVLVFQAARNAGLSQPQLASWIGALAIGSGLVSLMVCLWYRQPIVIAWSVAGSALLVSDLARYGFAEAIGAYVLAGVAMTMLGLSGLFRRALALVPGAVVMGMLAGVLLRFGVGLFAALPGSPVLVVTALAVFLFLQRAGARTPTIGALVAGLAVAALNGELQLAGVRPELVTPVWIWPEFSLRAALGLALPLFVLAVASQNAPGIAVLRASGYDPPVDGPISLTGVASILTAPLGGHGLNLAALMAAICASPEIHPDLQQRYGAGVTAALWFILFGLFGATAAALFAGFPTALIAVVAGLAMAAPIRSALTAAMAEPTHREGALFALLLSAADITLLGIGAPFWGLLLGVVVARLAQPRRG